MRQLVRLVFHGYGAWQVVTNGTYRGLELALSENSNEGELFAACTVTILLNFVAQITLFASLNPWCSTRGHAPQHHGPKATRVHHRFKREPSQYHHTLRQQHLPNNNSLQQEQKHTVPEEGAPHRNRSCHTGNDKGWHHNSLTKEVESTTHNRESSPLLRQDSPHKQAAQRDQGGHFPRRQFTGSRRSLHTNSLQHYSSVGYAANRPEFNTR